MSSIYPIRILTIPSNVILNPTGSNSAQSTLEKLPSEILLRIFKQADLFGRVALATTSKHLTNFAVNYPTDIIEFDQVNYVNPAPRRLEILTDLHLISREDYNPVLDCWPSGAYSGETWGDGDD
jgi:hypothetical protein